jgi:hypothetical protein
MKDTGAKPVVKCHCGRKVKFKVQKKWPSKKMETWVCGYHVRAYLTSEYRRIDLTPPPPKKQGYAMLVPTGGYGAMLD